MSRWLVVVVVACGAPPIAPLPSLPKPPDDSIALTDTNIGPITKTLRGNLIELRKALVGYEVIPVNVETAVEDPDFGLSVEEIGSVEYHVYDGDKRLFEIVTTSEGAILDVRIVTPRVVVKGKSWRVGAKLESGVGVCECWSGKPVCFNKGEHVAVGFTQRSVLCRDRIPSKHAFAGKTIARLVWSPKPFGDGEGGEEYGGDLIDP